MHFVFPLEIVKSDFKHIQLIFLCLCVTDSSFMFFFVVNYFENNRAGITVYGFMLDRSTLHTIFGIELSLVLWLLGKTIGIS